MQGDRPLQPCVANFHGRHPSISLSGAITQRLLSYSSSPLYTHNLHVPPTVAIDAAPADRRRDADSDLAGRTA